MRFRIIKKVSDIDGIDSSNSGSKLNNNSLLIVDKNVLRENYPSKVYDKKFSKDEISYAIKNVFNRDF